MWFKHLLVDTLGPILCATQGHLYVTHSSLSLAPTNIRVFIAVAMGSVTQFRLMGGAVTLSIINTARNAYLRSNLKGLLTPEQIGSLLDFAPTSKALDPATKHAVGIKLAEGYNLQTKILAAMAGVQVLSSLLMWQKKQIKV